MMAGYLLSPQAENSLTQISAYSLRQFGQQQKTKYLKMLREPMRSAAANPMRGRERHDIKQGYYSVQAESHHIYYRIRAAHIEIIDVLHQSMEPNLHF